ncbi:MAG: hypothetical protein ACI9JE_001378 [Candidatus Krumholzibacteriia bacterium]
MGAPVGNGTKAQTALKRAIATRLKNLIEIAATIINKLIVVATEAKTISSSIAIGKTAAAATSDSSNLNVNKAASVVAVAVVGADKGSRISAPTILRWWLLRIQA